MRGRCRIAFATTLIFEVETGGSDTLASGCFNPSNANMAADGAATSATGNSPVFSSASYNFVAGDVGAWVFIKSGTNWTPGWYKIASVSSNAATLSAAVGAAVLFTPYPYVPSTAAGCATTASPTSATWTVDYSQQTTARYSYTDLVIGGTNTQITSAGKPFGKNCVGNILFTSAGTGFNVQRGEISSVSGTTATGANWQTTANWGTASSTSGTGYLGGALATPGQAGALKTTSNKVFISSGTYTLSGSSVNTAGGPVSDTTGGAANAPTHWEGYGTVRGDLGTRPVISAGSVTSIIIFNAGAGYTRGRNITADGNSQTSTIGFVSASARTNFELCKAQNCTGTAGFTMSSGGNCIRCQATGCSGTAGFHAGNATLFSFCEAFANTTIGFNCAAANSVAKFCVSSANTGASSDGFAGATGTGQEFTNCTSYGNGRHGFNFGQGSVAENCIAEANSGWGYDNTNTTTTENYLLNCGAYSNTSGAVNTTHITRSAEGFVTNTTGSFFTNAASGDFSLNNTTNQGKLARATGYPGLFPRGLTTAYLDLGAAQHVDPSAGGVSRSRLQGAS